ncbi:UNVERIFIED_CONTAM: cysteine peptidase family C39 domain-containing protein, partial [Salmonella enterica subsp. enterica serovar Enteritidis]
MKGATLGTVLKLAEQHGLDGRAIQLHQISDVTKLRLPALLHFDDDHFVVLVRAGSKGVIIHDPAHGRVR